VKEMLQVQNDATLSSFVENVKKSYYRSIIASSYLEVEDKDVFNEKKRRNSFAF